MTALISDLPLPNKWQRVPTPADTAEAEREAQWRRDLSARLMRPLPIRPRKPKPRALPPAGVRHVTLRGVDAVYGEVEVVRRRGRAFSIMGRLFVDHEMVLQFVVSVDGKRVTARETYVTGYDLCGGAPVPRPDLTALRDACARAPSECSESAAFAEHEAVTDLLHEMSRYVVGVCEQGGGREGALAWLARELRGGPVADWAVSALGIGSEELQARSFVARFAHQQTT